LRVGAATSVVFAAACAESRHHAVTDQVLIASLRTADFATRDVSAAKASLANVRSAPPADVAAPTSAITPARVSETEPASNVWTLATQPAATVATNAEDDSDRRRAAIASRDQASTSPRVNANANVVTPTDGSSARAADVDAGSARASDTASTPPAIVPPTSQSASPDADASAPSAPQAWPGPGPFIFFPMIRVPAPAPASPEGGAP
jgi:hypothetical protein